MGEANCGQPGEIAAYRKACTVPRSRRRGAADAAGLFEGGAKRKTYPSGPLRRDKFGYYGGLIWKIEQLPAQLYQLTQSIE